MQIEELGLPVWNTNIWLTNSETEFELWLIEDMDTLAEKEKEEFIGHRVMAKNPENDWENNYFDEEYFDN